MSKSYTSVPSGQEEQPSREPLSPLESEWENTSTFGKVSFTVATPMIKRGCTKPLEYDDLMHLPEHCMCQNLLLKLQRCYATSKPFWFIPRLGVALLTSCKKMILITVLLTLAAELRFVTPILLGLFLEALENGSSAEVWGYTVLYSISFFLSVVLGPVKMFYSARMGLEMKNSTIALLYARLFSLDSSSLSGSHEKGAMTTGMLVNMISNDVGKYDMFAFQLPNHFTSPLEIILSLLALTYFLDVASAFAGVGVCLLIMPFQFYIAKLFGSTRFKTGSATDKRVRFTSEVISGISSVKSFAWESPFFQNIEGFREAELKFIRQSQWYRSLNLMVYAAVPAFGSLSTFSVYWATGGVLTTAKVFATVGILYQLRQTTGRIIPLCTMGTAEAIASTRRIEKFLELTDPKVGHLHDIDVGSDKRASTFDRDRDNGKGSGVAMVDETVRETQKHGNIRPFFPSGQTLVTVRRSAYSYGVRPSHGDTQTIQKAPALRDIEFAVKAGELVMVVGSVGAGKSSLLSMLLGDMVEVQPAGYGVDAYVVPDGDSVEVANGLSLAFCAQVPWIMASTVRANITVSGRSDVFTDRGQGAGASTPPFTGTSTSNPLHASSSLKSPLLLEENMPTVSASDKRADISAAKPISGRPDGGLQNCNTPISSYDDFKNPEHINNALYEKAIKCTCIIEDINQWPNSDETEIGERGISISGGQKARLGLARAVYSDADLYVLDDVLSAVDAQVGRSIFFGCIIEQLRDRKKGVILATHQQQYLKYADKIIVLENDGRQVFYGSHEELQERLHEFPHLAQSKTGGSADDLIQAEDAEASQKTDEKATYTTGQVSLKRRELGQKSQWNLGGMGQQAEDKKIGDVKELWNFVKQGGVVSAMLAGILVIAAQGIDMLNVYWLQFWAGETFGSQSRSFYVWVLALLTVACVLIGMYRPMQWFGFTRQAGRMLHRRALWAVLHSPLYFFVANPTGRILNRFSMDLGVVDERLPPESFDVIQMFVSICAAFLLAIAVIPYLLIVILPLVLLFYGIKLRYTIVQQETKRLDATTKSPIYSDFSATLEGLQTLKAYNLKDKASRSFMRLIDRNSRAYFNVLMVSRWATFRFDISVCIAQTFFVFMSAVLRKSVSIALVGFALQQLSTLTGLLQFCVRQIVEVETQLTSVERLTTYAHLEPEDGYSTTLKSLSESTSGVAVQKGGDKGPKIARENDSRAIQGGAIDIEDLHVRYRHDLDTVLKGVTIHIPAGAKVGICGRTGSGKSTTLLALLRLNAITGGDIKLDGKSLLQMDLETARSKIATIPQDPHLFSGTVRQNLDPFKDYSDAEIWSALEDAHIKDQISQSDAGLSCKVEESGKNFSVGQRQLLVMARAILRRSRVVLMDEVTANIDYKTDRLIQQSIRESPALRGSTIITIAHRLRTVADSDTIVVIRNGVVAETGTPLDLLRQSDSEFRTLAEESGEYGEILSIAKGEISVTSPIR